MPAGTGTYVDHLDWSLPLPPAFCVNAVDKGVTASNSVKAHSKGFTGPQLRPKTGKTRYWLVKAHSKGLKLLRDGLKRRTRLYTEAVYHKVKNCQ